MLTELQPGRKLLHLVEEWLRREKEQRQAAVAAGGSGTTSSETTVVPNRTPIMPSKHLAFFR
jgi:CCR4-NOT complex subunit CAF16